MGVRGVLRRAGRALATGAAFVAVALVAILAVLVVWPTDTATVAGASVEVGAQRPGADLSLAGPGQVESFGQVVDVRAVRVVGPVRPYLETNVTPYDLIGLATTAGAPQEAGAALTEAFAAWALRRTPAVLLVGLALLVGVGALLSFIGVLPHLDRRSARWYLRRVGVGGLVTAVVWAGALGAAAAGSRALADVDEIEDLFDYDVLRTSPPPTGEPRVGYEVVVLGDSRVAVHGGAPLSSPAPEDEACGRSRDSLARQLERVVGRGWEALNLACTGATIERGLLQPQLTGGVEVPAQVGRLKQVREPEVVVVSVGPNDVYWGPVVGSCYITSCNVTGLATVVNSALAEFARSYADLLADIADLEADPQVVVVGAYEPFARGATCPDTRLPDGSGRLTEQELETVSSWRARLEAILAEGAAEHGFTYVTPDLVPLCTPDLTGLGPDVWPLESEYRFHPTPVGVLKTALSVAGTIEPGRLDPEQAGTAGEDGEGPGTGGEALDP